MRLGTLALATLTLSLLGVATATPLSAAAEEVTWTAVDGVTLYGDVYAVEAGKASPLVLLFHQARGDARGEYEMIIPRLLEAGFNVFAIDLRSGGSRFEGVNRARWEALRAESTGTAKTLLSRDPGDWVMSPC